MLFENISRRARWGLVRVYGVEEVNFRESEWDGEKGKKAGNCRGQGPSQDSEGGKEWRVSVVVINSTDEACFIFACIPEGVLKADDGDPGCAVQKVVPSLLILVRLSLKNLQVTKLSGAYSCRQ